MKGTTAPEMASEATDITLVPLEVNAIQTAEEPDESWSDKMLLDCGRAAINESDLLEAQAQPFIRQSIDSRLRGGHAMSILRARLKAEGRWLGFQQENALPRTTMWQMIEVYERSAKDGYTAQDLIDNYGNWTSTLLGYGLAKPRKNKVGGHDTEYLEAPKENDDDVRDDGVEGDFDGADVDYGDGSEGDAEEDESDDESADAEPDGIAEEEIPPVTADQIGAADTFVAAVGGLTHAVRVLITKSVNGGDKDAVKGAVAEAVRAARAVLTPAEITEIVIVDNCKAKGIDLVSV